MRDTPKIALLVWTTYNEIKLYLWSNNWFWLFDNSVPGISQSILMESYSTFYIVFSGSLTPLNTILMRFEWIISIFRHSPKVAARHQFYFFKKLNRLQAYLVLQRFADIAFLSTSRQGTPPAKRLWLTEVSNDGLYF